MPNLTDLPDAPRKVMKAYHGSSVSRFISHVRLGRAVSSAGDNGAINVWRDKFGNYRAEFQRFMSTKGSHTGKSLAGLRNWLRVWYPKMER